MRARIQSVSLNSRRQSQLWLLKSFLLWLMWLLWLLSKRFVLPIL